MPTHSDVSNFTESANDTGEATGNSICDEALNVRIEEAKRLLRDPWRTIDSLVDFSGYKSASYFKKAFKRKTGATMREWRRMHLD